MPNMELLTRRVLEHVEVDRWQRPAALLQLLAHLAPDGQAVPLRRSDLVSLDDRTLSGARHDQEWLLRLAANRVLYRWPARGPQPAVWAVNPWVDHWLHVPWLTSRKIVAGLVLQGIAGPPRAKARGKSRSERCEAGPPAAESGLRRNLTRAFTPPEGPALARGGSSFGPTSYGNEGAGGPALAQGSPPLDYASRETSSLSSPLGERRGEEDCSQQPSAPSVGRLALALSKAMGGQPIYGRLLTRLEEIENHASPEQLAQLLERCKAHARTRMVTWAVADLETCAMAMIDLPTEDPSERARVLRRLIATKAELGIDTSDEQTELEAIEPVHGPSSGIG